MATKTLNGTAYPASSFLVVPDSKKPSDWALPVKDPAGKPDHRLMGAAFAALTSDYRGNGYDGPDKPKALAKLKSLYTAEKMDWPATAKHAVLDAEFAVESTEEDGEDIVLTGRLFKSGSYPEVSFEMSPEELHAAIDAFTAPVAFDLHHKPNIFNGIDLSGSFGLIEQVWRDETGEWMMAKARKPKWLAAVMPETRVSATFARANKRLTGAAWTAHPIVPGAELVAAFAGSGKHDTPNGQRAIQAAHDVFAANGAVCKAGMASRHEASAIQQGHDLMVAHGATCENSATMPSLPAFAYARDTPEQGTVPDQSSIPPPSRRTRTMKLLDYITGQAKEAGVDLDTSELEAAFSASASAASAEDVEALKAENTKKDAALTAMQAALDEQKVEFARQAAERRHEHAVAYAESQVAAHRITPAAAEKLAALTERIATSDSTAQFAEGVKSSKELLEDFLGSMLDLTTVFTENKVANDMAIAALFSETETAGIDPNKPKEYTREDLDKLHSYSPVGRQVVAERSQAK